MRKYLSALVLLVAVFTCEANAQYQNVITPPHGGVPIVAGGWYTAGTVFSNGMAYMPGSQLQQVAHTSYYVPSVGYTHSYANYPQSHYYGNGYSSFGFGYSFGTGNGYSLGYSNYGRSAYPNNGGYYGSYSSFGPTYGRGYSGNRGYSGRRR
jgi:hypothetical protein